ncbi:ComEA family DNA-binding protein, partial [Staphylococcus aureus]
MNLNNATETDLKSIPGVGPSKAREIINYREQN